MPGPRIVCDLNVLVSGLIEPRGPSRRVLRAVLSDEAELVVCPRWIAEAMAVCIRPKHRTRFSIEEAERLIAGLEAGAEVHADPAEPARLTPDADDDYLVALAVGAACDALVSGDRHLLDAELPIAVLTPREFVERQGLTGPAASA